MKIDLSEEEVNFLLDSLSYSKLRYEEKAKIEDPGYYKRKIAFNKKYDEIVQKLRQ